MTEQEKNKVNREFDRLENQIESNYALYEEGYKSGVFDAREVVNELLIHVVSKCCKCEENEGKGKTNQCDNCLMDGIM